MKRLNLLLTTVLLVVLTACAALGVELPTTFNQKLAVAVAGVTEARQTATTLLQAGKISAADAQNIQAQADVAREGLNVARDLFRVDADNPSAALTRLEMTNAALKALQAYLLTKQGATK